MIDIKHLTELANITLSEEEERLFKEQLEDIVNFVSQLEKVDTDNDATVKNEVGNILREDIVKKSLTIEEVLKNTDSIYNNYISVDLVLKNKKIIK